MSKPIKKQFRIRRFLKKERGTQILELAIALPVMMILLGAVGEFGRFFYTYSAASKLSVSSTAGDLTLNNSPSSIKLSLPAGGLNTVSFKLPNLTVYPASLDAVALSGSVQVNETRLFPSPAGNLNLLANGNVNVGFEKGALSGNINSEIRSKVAQDRAAFGISGNVARPLLKRGG